MSKKILITGANQSLAYQLAWYFKDQEILFCDNKIHQNLIPSPSSNSFGHQFLNYCLDNQVEIVFPLRDEEIHTLSESLILFKEFEIDLILPSFKSLPDFDEDRLKNYSTNQLPILIEDFSQFSAHILKAGYPKKSVFFSRADSIGKIYEIYDEADLAELVWLNGCRISFTQTSKLVNQQPFIPLFIYPEVSEINYLNVLFMDENIFTESDLSVNRRATIQKISKEYKIQGFYELAFADDLFLRIKPASIC
jgi:hypothetical protein